MQGEGAWATLEELMQKCSLRVREYFIAVSFLHRNIAIFKMDWQRMLWAKTEVKVLITHGHLTSYSLINTPDLPHLHEEVYLKNLYHAAQTHKLEENRNT